MEKRNISDSSSIEITTELQAQLLNEANDGISLLNREGTILYVNDMYCKIHGLNRETLLGMNMREIPSDATAETFEKIERELSQYQSARFETTHYHKDGTPIYLDVHAKVIESGGKRFSLNIERDISERKLTEMNIQENFIYLEKLTDSLGATVFSVKLPERIIEWANDSIFLFGYQPGEVIGKTTELLYAHRDEYRRFGEQLVQVIESGSSTMYYDVLLKKKSGDTFKAEVYTNVFRENNQPIRVISVVRDVTERRKQEEAREEAARMESIGTLAGGIAHDFNNILTGIMGNVSLAEIALNEGDIADAKQLIQEVDQASSRAKDLTYQLLTFSRGGQPIKKVTSIEPILRNSVEFALRGSTVIPRFIIADDLRLVEVDEGQMNQVFSNIVINAVQAMPEGGEITIEAKNHTNNHLDDDSTPGPDYLEISITDSGPGIPEYHIQRVFEPYFTTKQKGSGLGLATCYSIVHKHEGEIKIESELGKGTTVRILLPVSEKESTEYYTEDVSATIRGHGRILIMDDEESIRKMLSSGLYSAGYDVTAVENGEKAIEEYADAMKSDSPYAVVIMDLTVRGGIGGKEATEKIKEIDPDAIVIVSSGYAQNSVLANFREYGFSDVIEKPYRINQVKNILLKHIK